MGVHNAAERFNPAAGSWQTLPPMAYPRCNHVVATLAGRVYACGGWDGADVLNQAEAFFPDSGTWQQMPPMLVKRYFAVGLATGRHLYICGGQSSHNTAMDSVER